MTAKSQATDDDRETRAAFHDVVNMTPAELKKWLATEESRGVGVTDSGEKAGGSGKESVGHHSGNRIVEILHTKVADLDADDYAHMRKVVGYVHRHTAQRPKGDITDTPWRRSLMNWGHDPAKS